MFNWFVVFLDTSFDVLKSLNLLLVVWELRQNGSVLH